MAPATSAALLGDLSAVATPRLDPAPDISADELDAAWATSGAMALTGRPERPLLAPPRLTAQLLRVGRWIRSLGGIEVDPLALLAERATLAGWSRRGDVSCGGRTRLLPCADGWIAVALAREHDLAAVPAWLESPVAADDWSAIARAVRGRRAAEVAGRGRLLGLPVAPLGRIGRRDGPAVRAQRVDDASAPRRRAAGALVVDLSALWAGPLCAHLLQAAGARIVKVESLRRPDGARAAEQHFALLHGGQESVALDFATDAGRADLRRLVAAADVVIESSRPRALQQLGIDRDEVLRHGRPRLWISITGYGREGEAAAWVAFGDDAAVAGGLVAWDHGEPCFCADAVADPATGLVAAAAAFAALDAGRWTVDVSLADVSAALADYPRTDWRAGAPADAPAVRPRPVVSPAPALGRDTDLVLTQLADAGLSGGGVFRGG